MSNNKVPSLDLIKDIFMSTHLPGTVDVARLWKPQQMNQIRQTRPLLPAPHGAPPAPRGPLSALSPSGPRVVPPPQPPKGKSGTAPGLSQAPHSPRPTALAPSGPGSHRRPRWPCRAPWRGSGGHGGPYWRGSAPGSAPAPAPAPAT